MAFRVPLKTIQKTEVKILTVYRGPDSEIDLEFEDFKPQELMKYAILTPIKTWYVKLEISICIIEFPFKCNNM